MKMIKYKSDDMDIYQVSKRWAHIWFYIMTIKSSNLSKRKDNIKSSDLHSCLKVHWCWMRHLGAPQKVTCPTAPLPDTQNWTFTSVFYNFHESICLFFMSKFVPQIKSSFLIHFSHKTNHGLFFRVLVFYQDTACWLGDGWIQFLFLYSESSQETIKQKKWKWMPHFYGKTTRAGYTYAHWSRASVAGETRIPREKLPKKE